MCSAKFRVYIASTAVEAFLFRYDSSTLSRQETITFCQYGIDGITLSAAYERLNDVKKTIATGAGKQNPVIIGKIKIFLQTLPFFTVSPSLLLIRKAAEIGHKAA
ncbi:hypothetical protein C5E19_06210 [Pectobacterium parmentieri]|nr:hypothetical protein C5E26_06190 [Pectobacterium parmentieri]AYH05007.1 hypothetical protein C5E25_06360 [Pectobacterium parmentieri]AYH22531.1 hypothetical protein C5E21_06340 [Pectobacterium parmentieri]AYH26800.1 hypothetical protein C5E20_06440 [Pectobacterium parmentieri]AYH31249.1 hypothetical protein C5E19_06210 [Pectobacterium parmentieri]